MFESVELGYIVIDNELTLYNVFGLLTNGTIGEASDVEIQRRLAVSLL